MNQLEKDFLVWYFSGSDQEQEAVLLSLGQRVKDDLLEKGEFFINEDTLAMECMEVYEQEKKQ